jgi:hypothetical protein
MKDRGASVPGRLENEGFALKQSVLIGLCVEATSGTAIALYSTKEGLIEYIGAQKDIFKKEAVVETCKGTYAYENKPLYCQGYTL